VSSWDGNGHGTELAEDLLPLFHKDAFLGDWHLQEDGVQAFLKWWIGSSRVLATVSMIYPRISFHVAQYASPCLRFFVDAGSLRWGSSNSLRGPKKT
jgi:hypothetical protein